MLEESGSDLVRRLWDEPVRWVAPTSAAAFTGTRPVRGMDAVYLAAAARLSEAGPVGLLSFDRRQRDAVTAEDGIGLLPATVS